MPPAFQECPSPAAAFASSISLQIHHAISSRPPSMAGNHAAPALITGSLRSHRATEEPPPPSPLSHAVGEGEPQCRREVSPPLFLGEGPGVGASRAGCEFIRSRRKREHPAVTLF